MRIIFRQNIGDFSNILPIFCSNRFSISKILLIPADIGYIGDISANKTNILFLGCDYGEARKTLKTDMLNKYATDLTELAEQVIFLNFQYDSIN